MQKRVRGRVLVGEEIESERAFAGSVEGDVVVGDRSDGPDEIDKTTLGRVSIWRVWE